MQSVPSRDARPRARSRGAAISSLDAPAAEPEGLDPALVQLDLQHARAAAVHVDLADALDLQQLGPRCVVDVLRRYSSMYGP
jgi:hypothetical protein